jgi:sugar phosphate isomerase/epimerase
MTLDRFGINTVSTRQPDLPAALEAYSVAGFANVELVIPHAKEWMSGGRTVADLRDELERRGLRCVGGFETVLECFSSAESREANLALHIANAELLHALGGGAMVVGTDGPLERSVAALDDVGGRLRTLAEQTDGLDMNIAVEFNWSPLVKSFLSAVRVVRVAAHPRAGILFDPAHYHCTSSKLEHLTPENVALIRHCHFNDMRAVPGDFANCNEDRVLPGEGILPLREMVRRLEDGGYRGTYSLEMFNHELWGQPVAEAAARCYASLAKLAKEME